jgi:hypothetical protein
MEVYMKKRILSMFVAILAVAGVLCGGVAHAAPLSITMITGVVTHSGTPVAGATVVASCGRYFADTDVTGADGAYLTSLPISECGWGSDVELLAITDTNFGTALGRANQITSRLNVADTDIALP